MKSWLWMRRSLCANTARYAARARPKSSPGKSAAMKMAPRRLKINNLQSDLMQTPFSCKVERQRRMMSYRNVAEQRKASYRESRRSQWVDATLAQSPRAGVYEAKFVPGR